MVRVCGSATNNDAKDDWVLGHEFGHWFQSWYMADIHANGSLDEPDFRLAADFGEGFASVLGAMFVNGESWNSSSMNDVVTIEDRDYNGKIFKLDGQIHPALPADLWGGAGFEGTLPSANGGWSWRIIEDARDPNFIFKSEPDEWFTRGPYLGIPVELFVYEDHPGFDHFGGTEVTHDVFRMYMGGNLITENTTLTGVGPHNKDLVGSMGLDTADFLNGVICRGWADAAEVEELANNVMDYQDYVPNNAPVVCPL